MISKSMCASPEEWWPVQPQQTVWNSADGCLLIDLQLGHERTGIQTHQRVWPNISIQRHTGARMPLRPVCPQNNAKLRPMWHLSTL